MFRIRFIFLFTIILWWNNAAFAELSLKFDDQQNTTLSGEWNYYPDYLIMSEQNNNKSHEPKRVNLPDSFLSLSGAVDGIASFQQKVILPQDAVGRTIYLYIPYQYGAYQLYVDQRLIARVGKVGQREDHETMMAPKLASFYAQDREIQVTLQVSSFNHIRGGLENPIYIGYTTPILHQFYRQLISLTLMSGILLMTGFFMLLFALYRRNQDYVSQPLLFLSLFILCFSTRSFFAVPFLYSLFTDLNWLWGTRIEYLLTEFACLFFLTYLYLLPKNLLHRYVFYVLSSVIVINIAVTITQPPLIFQDTFFKSFAFSLIMFINLIYAIFFIFRKKLPYSKLNAFAIFILCLTFLHDYLLGIKLIDSVEIAFYSSCIYFICVTLQLSRDYANKSLQSERLNRKLLQLNKSLDQKVFERTKTVEQLNKKLELQVRTDALTGSFNRHALNLEIQKRYDLACQQQHTLSFLMIDVDYFKNYNDYYGHLKGDEILSNLVAALSRILPKDAFLARYGGEEFAIILSVTPFESVRAIANQCLLQVRRQMWEHLNRLDEKSIVTVSIGGAVMDCQHTYSDLLELMKTADQQLYVAKKNRDSVSIKL